MQCSASSYPRKGPIVPRMPTAAARVGARRALDRRLAPMRPVLTQTTAPRGGWVRAIRESIGMSLSDLAARMGTTGTTALRMEAAEREDRIQLGTLRRAADALGCDLVYALLPRQPLEDMVNERARVKAAVLLARVGHSMLLEDQQVTPAVASEQLTGQATRVASRPGLWSDD